MSCVAVNLFGGPGAGKSTTAARLFAELKEEGINCELITEYAKDKVWEESYHVLDNQIYMFGKQSHRQFRVKNKVDVLITDSPLPMMLHYGRDFSMCFKDLVMEVFHEYDNLNYIIERGNAFQYNPVGRNQDEVEAQLIHDEIRNLLVSRSISYKTIHREDDKDNNIRTMINDVRRKLGV